MVNGSWEESYNKHISVRATVTVAFPIAAERIQKLSSMIASLQATVEHLKQLLKEKK